MHAMRSMIFVLAAAGLLRPAIGANPAVRVEVDVPPVDASNQQQMFKQHRGHLLRELVRQAVLITAQQEFGCQPSDPSLLEAPPADAQEKTLQVTFDAPPGKPVHVELFVAGEKVPLAALDIPAAAPGDAKHLDYVQLATGLEAAMRKEISDALEKAGLKKAKPAFKEPEAVPELEKMLGVCDPLFQFNMLRWTHMTIAKDGEWTPLMAALVREYAMIGMLTEGHWNSMHKTFKARSLLHAQRLVARNRKPEDPAPLFLRAYALALTGLHGAALQDLTAANKLVTPETPAPRWAAVIEAFCKYDLPALQAAVKDEEVAALAAQLRCIALTECSSRNLLRPAVDEALAHGSLRALDAAAHKMGVPDGHRYTAYADRYLRSYMPDQLRESTELPPKIRELIPADVSTEHLSAKRLAELLQALEKTPDEWKPSWKTFSRMYQEMCFQAVEQRAEFLRYQYGIGLAETKRYVQEMEPLIADHPYANLVRIYASPDVLEQQQKLAAGVQDEEPVLAAARFCTFAWNLHNLKPFRNRIVLHLDDVPQDLDRAYPWFSSLDSYREATRRLLAISPHWPTAAVHLVYDCPEMLPEHGIVELKKQFGNDPRFLLNLAGYHQKKKDWASEAEACEAYAELTHEWWMFSRLAYLYRYQLKQPEKFLPTMKRAFDYPENDAVGVANLAATMSDELVQRGEYKEALKYAEMGARTGAGAPLVMAGMCHELLKDYDKAEEYYRGNAERYERAAGTWYLFCKRTGKGDVEAARRMFEQQIAGKRGEDRLWDEAVMLELEGKPEAAAKYKACFDLSHNPGPGLAAALLMLEAKDEEGAKGLLARVQKEGGQYAFGDYSDRGGKRTELMALAKLFEDALEKKELPGQAAIREIAATSTMFEEVNVQYYGARFFEVWGDKKRAEKHYRAAMAQPRGVGKISFTLAAVGLRRLGATTE